MPVGVEPEASVAVARATAPPPEVAPAVTPPPAARPQRLLGLLAAFLEEKNIRWGEIVGGLLIVGCSLALVMSFWSSIAERPLLKYGLFTGVTALVFAARPPRRTPLAAADDGPGTAGDRHVTDPAELPGGRLAQPRGGGGSRLGGCRRARGGGAIRLFDLPGGPFARESGARCLDGGRAGAVGHAAADPQVRRTQRRDACCCCPWAHCRCWPRGGRSLRSSFGSGARPRSTSRRRSICSGCSA